MKTLISIFLILFSLEQVSAQEIITKNHSIPLDENSTISFELEGEIFLNTWDLPDGEITVETIIKGRVFGYSTDSKRKEYDVVIEKSENLITVKEKPRKSSIKIGIITLRVKHRHIIYLSSSTKISFISENAEINVKGNFNALEIINKSGDCKLKLNMERIKFLGCFADEGKLIINNTKKDKRFTLIGDGEEVYSIETSSGKIMLDLIKKLY